MDLTERFLWSRTSDRMNSMPWKSSERNWSSKEKKSLMPSQKGIFWPPWTILLLSNFITPFRQKIKYTSLLILWQEYFCFYLGRTFLFVEKKQKIWWGHCKILRRLDTIGSWVSTYQKDHLSRPETIKYFAWPLRTC